MAESNYGKLDLGSPTSAPSDLAEQPPSYTPGVGENIVPRNEKTSAFDIPNQDEHGTLIGSSSGPNTSTSYYASVSPRSPGQAHASTSSSPTGLMAQPAPFARAYSSASLRSIPSPGAQVSTGQLPLGAQKNATPPQFTRPPPPEISYTTFSPTFIIARGKTLDKGFHRAPPPSKDKQHPFATHDIGEEDWLSFLDAIVVTASLTEKDMHRSYYLPVISAIPVINTLAAAGYQKAMKHRKSSKVARLVEEWNYYFFEPRKIRVILMKGWTEVTEARQLPFAHSEDVQAVIPTNDDTYRLFIVPLTPPTLPNSE